MILRKSLKQMLRTPVTTALFMALLAIAAFFVCSGMVVWARNQAVIKIYEDVFVTIGTVRQLPTSMELTERWDAGLNEYTRMSTPQFTSIVSPSVLNFDNAGYVLGPERRAYYGAFLPDMQLLPETHSWESGFIVEFTPIEDCIPSGPVDVLIERVVAQTPPYYERVAGSLSDGDIVRLCDHYNDAPQPLYSGITYIAYIYVSNHTTGTTQVQREFRPERFAFSTQYRPDGIRIEGNVSTTAICEVADGFYETEEGRRWLGYADSLASFHPFNTLPVLPTYGTHLLMPFYNGMAYVAEGEDISPEEYENGELVCLISKNFADMNGISPGDKLRLPLYYADYRNAPNDAFRELDPNSYVVWKGPVITGSLLDSDGGVFQVFSDNEYTVKGIYASFYGRDASFAMGNNTVIIPRASVQESDAGNILAYGPMKDTTTAFQIPNGSIEDFMEHWLSQGFSDELEITFYDRGYTRLWRGLENMKRVSMLFLAIGSAMSLALVFFFCHVFITKNKMRTAIERMLGYTKKQCAVSLLSGFFVSALIAVAVGCAAGVLAQGYITGGIAQQAYFDTSFTIGPLGQYGMQLEEAGISAFYAPISGLALLIECVIVSAIFMRGNVKEEPLKLLGGKRQ